MVSNMTAPSFAADTALGRKAWRVCGVGVDSLLSPGLASRRLVRTQNELPAEAARLETAVCLGDLIEGDPLGDARPDGASCQQPEEPLKVLAEPGGMSRPHHIDRVAAGTLTARQQ